ncbi:MAG: putative inner rane protein [Polyangiaceae bacterium]|jgi:AAA family ATP:ADP antiporter|nr:putative inner rane protein [Polyangiaceae bacterium]
MTLIPAATTSNTRLRDRVLSTLFRPFSKVEPGEVVGVVTLSLAAFLLLTAYYLLKTVREPLILLQGGAEVKLYARAGQAVLMAVFVHFYGELARSVGRTKLLGIVFSFFISNLVLFAALSGSQVQIGLPFFLWVGVFSYTIVAQFWGLAADLCSEEQGKRLFPIIGAGSSLGAVAGARFAKSLVPLGPQTLMGVAVLILLLCALLMMLAGRRPLSTASRESLTDGAAPLAQEEAFHLLFRDKYLLLIAAMVIVLNWVNSSGEYLLDRALLAAARAAHGTEPLVFVGTFKADYFASYNMLGLALQLFGVSRILKLVGVRKALYALPTFALLAYGTVVFLPALAVLRWVKIGENSIQYSLQDTTRNALFLMTSRVERFVGKTAVDTVAVRMGAIMSALTAYAGSRAGWSNALFAGINVGLAIVWLFFVVAIGREHLRRSRESADALAAEPRLAGARAPLLDASGSLT